MTEAIITWQEKQKDNNLSDDQLSYKVKRRIDKWQNQTNTIPDIEQAITDTNAELQQHTDKPNGHAYKRIKKQADELEALLTDTKAEVADLNSILCQDMDRLVRDAEKNKALAARFKKTKTATTETVQEPAPPPSANNTDTESITDNMKADLYCLNYTQEDIDVMSVATAVEILQKKKGKSAASGQVTEETTPASVSVMITNSMRQQLHEMGYSKEDIDAMTPAQANGIITNKAAGPGAATNKEEPGPASAQHSVENNTTTGNANPQQAAVVKIKPVRTELIPTDQQKKTQNAVLVGLGTAVSFVVGILIGRRLMK